MNRVALFRSHGPPAAARRRFLRAGIAGSALLLLGRRLPAAAAPAETTDYLHLTAADAGMLRRIVPVMLEGALPAGGAERRHAIDEVLGGIDSTIDSQPPVVRREIRDLFDLLTRSITRALVAGIWTSWDRASDEDVREFLAGWRTSRFVLLRSAFVGLNNLILGAWYDNPRSWARIGYGGPPRIA
ncbi:MAG TPA: hypothetical protein VF203_04740 [Burkholderiales bacterium]